MLFKGVARAAFDARERLHVCLRQQALFAQDQPAGQFLADRPVLDPNPYIFEQEPGAEAAAPDVQFDERALLQEPLPGNSRKGRCT
jgi:hypothetical protein